MSVVHPSVWWWHCSYYSGRWTQETVPWNPFSLHAKRGLVSISDRDPNCNPADVFLERKVVRRGPIWKAWTGRILRNTNLPEPATQSKGHRSVVHQALKSTNWSRRKFECCNWIQKQKRLSTKSWAGMCLKSRWMSGSPNWYVNSSGVLSCVLVGPYVV